MRRTILGRMPVLLTDTLVTLMALLLTDTIPVVKPSVVQGCHAHPGTQNYRIHATPELQLHQPPTVQVYKTFSD